ncbi:MAG TPA: carbohydrate ABC transporter permease [Fimbriimonas sp.]|nr:carbohydrate ABC transporter permease [Fimbriimonas sp.]
MKKVLGNVLLIAFGVSIIVPFLWVLATSLKSGPEIFSTPWALPEAPSLKNYGSAWVNGRVGQNFMNSLVVTIATLVFLIPIGSMAAYVLAKYPFKGSKLILNGFIGGLMFPNFLIIIPLYLMVSKLGLLNSKTGLVIVYVAYSLSFTIFVLHGFFQQLPSELLEASELDGCSHSATFWKVMFPLARPGVLVVAIFNGIGLWNEYPLAMVLAATNEVQTLPVGISFLTMNQQYQADWGGLFAGVVIVMLPVMLLYVLFREQIQKTMIAGAIKG